MLSKNYITSNQCDLHMIFPIFNAIFQCRLNALYYSTKYLSRNVVQTVVVFAYVSKSEITFPSAVSWHMIILHSIEKVKKTKWNYYLQEGSNFMPYYIDTIRVHYKWDYFKTTKLIRSLSFDCQNKRKSEGTAQAEDK